jgi:hypothetical protein
MSALAVMCVASAMWAMPTVGALKPSGPLRL